MRRKKKQKRLGNPYVSVIIFFHPFNWKLWNFFTVWSQIGTGIAGAIVLPFCPPAGAAICATSIGLGGTNLGLQISYAKKLSALKAQLEIKKDALKSKKREAEAKQEDLRKLEAKKESLKEETNRNQSKKKKLESKIKQDKVDREILASILTKAKAIFSDLKAIDAQAEDLNDDFETGAKLSSNKKLLWKNLDEKFRDLRLALKQLADK